MPIRVTLKIQGRDKRTLEVLLSESQLAKCRQAFWQSYQPNDYVVDLSRALQVLQANVPGQLLAGPPLVVALHAVAAVSLRVGGTYWCRARTPPASPHQRMRAFADEHGNVHCPKCKCLLMEGEEFHVAPHEFSKLMKNPRFICYQCNTEVIVSSRRAQYKAALEKTKHDDTRGGGSK